MWTPTHVQVTGEYILVLALKEYTKGEYIWSKREMFFASVYLCIEFRRPVSCYAPLPSYSTLKFLHQNFVGYSVEMRIVYCAVMHII